MATYRPFPVSFAKDCRDEGSSTATVPCKGKLRAEGDTGAAPFDRCVPGRHIPLRGIRDFSGKDLTSAEIGFSGFFPKKRRPLQKFSLPPIAAVRLLGSFAPVKAGKYGAIRRSKKQGERK